jgi:catechol 2,3-dioxygenase-like lactoylglutathione lyase family enzyme
VEVPVRSATTWAPPRNGPGILLDAVMARPCKQMDNRRQRQQSRRMDIRIQCLCIDTTDPARLAKFWQAVLGWRLDAGPDGNEVVLEPSEGSPEDGVAPDLLFLRVPEEKAGKNRLHIDLRPADQAAEVARLEGLGARRADVGQHADVSWVVLADPDGNEFCVLRALGSQDQAYEGVPG